MFESSKNVMHDLSVAVEDEIDRACEDPESAGAYESFDEMVKGITADNVPVMNASLAMACWQDLTLGFPEDTDAAAEMSRHHGAFGVIACAIGERLNKVARDRLRVEHEIDEDDMGSPPADRLSGSGA